MDRLFNQLYHVWYAECILKVWGSNLEIDCKYAAGYRTGRHNYLVNKAILKIDNKKRPRPVCSTEGNLMDDGGWPDIEFWYNG